MSFVVFAARRAPAGKGCRPCPPYLCQVGRMTVDPSMPASGRLPRVGSATLAGQLSGGARTVNSGTNPEGLAEKVNSGTNPDELAEKVNSGTNPEDLAERANLGTNLRDLAERVNSGTNPEDLAERVNSDTNTEDFAERVNSDTNPEDLADNVNSGTNPEDFVENVNSDMNPEDFIENVNSGTNPEDLAEKVNSGTNPKDFIEKVNLGTNPEDFIEKVNSGTNHEDLILFSSVGMTSSDSSSSVRVISSRGRGMRVGVILRPVPRERLRGPRRHSNAPGICIWVDALEVDLTMRHKSRHGEGESRSHSKDKKPAAPSEEPDTPVESDEGGASPVHHRPRSMKDLFKMKVHKDNTGYYTLQMSKLEHQDPDKEMKARWRGLKNST
ncbi:hypothetical protein B296_00022429 [Ensete ventricosum]|uniref:Uncharacterized protein n=1 Tax=Ensete ventricosum TaxID=4639 RepID=A0A426XSG1_ENSVE|nr:hypothetical protein B296_00022429 [Ensete ventricosum]